MSEPSDLDVLSQALVRTRAAAHAMFDMWLDEVTGITVDDEDDDSDDMGEAAGNA